MPIVLVVFSHLLRVYVRLNCLPFQYTWVHLRFLWCCSVFSLWWVFFVHHLLFFFIFFICLFYIVCPLYHGFCCPFWYLQTFHTLDEILVFEVFKNKDHYEQNISKILCLLSQEKFVSIKQVGRRVWRYQRGNQNP